MNHVIRKYRRLNKPSDDVDVYDIIPIMPPQIPDMLGNCRFKLDYSRNIVFALAYRGIKDDIPTFMFAGSGYTLPKKVFRSLLGENSPLKAFSIYQEHPACWRNGKVWWRTIIELTDFNEQMIGIKEFALIVRERMKKECWCNVEIITLNKFLNV